MNWSAVLDWQLAPTILLGKFLIVNGSSMLKVSSRTLFACGTLFSFLVILSTLIFRNFNFHPLLEDCNFIVLFFS